MMTLPLNIMAILAQKYKMKVVGQVDLVNMYQLEGDLTVEQKKREKTRKEEKRKKKKKEKS